MNIQANKSLILIDANTYLYKAYYIFSSLNNKLSEPTGAVYGLINIINNIIFKYKTKNCYLALIFDAPGLNFRNKIYSQYKSNRSKMPIDLSNQIQILFKIFKYMGLKSISVNKVEADDVIGTLAIIAEKLNFNVLISSIDKDFLQLVTSKINIIKNNYIINHKNAKNELGIHPKLVVDYLALVGDNSDNIPGVPKIGKKTALILLNNFGKIKNLYNNLKNIEKINLHNSNQIIIQLNKYRDIAFMSYDLAKIKTDLKLNISLDDLNIKQQNITKLIKLFKYFNLKQWLKELYLGKWPKWRNIL